MSGRARPPTAGRNAGEVTVLVGRLDPLVSIGLAQVLADAPGIRVIDSELDCAVLTLAVQRGVAAVAILDETAAPLSQLERLASARRDAAVVVLAGDPSRARGLRLLGRGISCVARDAPAASVLAAVRTAALGSRTFVGPRGQVVARREPIDGRLLTARQRQALSCLSAGMTNAQIAHAMSISVETARTHVADVLRKLGVGSRRELIGASLKTPHSGT